MRRLASLLVSTRARRTSTAGWLALAAFAAPLATPLMLHAQSGSQPGSVAGTYALDRKASDDVQKAINAAVKDMNFITRPIARGRLEKTNQPYQQVVIATSGANTMVTIDKLPARSAPSTGTPIEWKRPADGEKMKLSMRWEGGHLIETFRPDDGQRVNEYALSPDGTTMTLHVTVTSPRLPKPVQYKLVYRKA